MNDFYTATSWIVKPGQESEFIRRWTEFAEWSREQGLSADAMLLSDVDDPARFVSFGPWESLNMIGHWRSLPGFHERVAKLNEVVVAFEPRTLQQVRDHHGWVRRRRN